MKFLLTLYAAPDAGPEPGSPEQAAEMEEWFAYTQALAAAGVLLGGEGLDDSKGATTVRVRDGEITTTDGPFAETKEVLGGFYLIEVEDEAAAIEWAAKVPIAPYGSVELRAVMNYE